MELSHNTSNQENFFSIYPTKTDYLEDQLKNILNHDSSECEKSCGPCWWKGITIPPSSGSWRECQKCVKMTNQLKERLKSVSRNKGQALAKRRVLEVERFCCSACLWWDWHHNTRLSFGIDFTYVRERDSKHKREQ
jgi:hypothetical protein